MKLRDLLLNKTEVYDLVIFQRAGYYIGCTIIDHEDLFIGSLNSKLLDSEVNDYYYEEQSMWNRQKVMIVNIKY